MLIDAEGASCATICLDPIAVNARRDMSTTRSGGCVWVGFFRETRRSRRSACRSASAPSHLTPAAAPVYYSVASEPTPAAGASYSSALSPLQLPSACDSHHDGLCSGVWTVCRQLLLSYHTLSDLHTRVTRHVEGSKNAHAWLTCPNYWNAPINAHIQGQNLL